MNNSEKNIKWEKIKWLHRKRHFFAFICLARKNIGQKNCEKVYFGNFAFSRKFLTIILRNRRIIFLTKFSTVFASFRKIHFRDIQTKLLREKFRFWNPSVQFMCFVTHQWTMLHRSNSFNKWFSIFLCLKQHQKSTHK